MSHIKRPTWQLDDWERDLSVALHRTHSHCMGPLGSCSAGGLEQASQLPSTGPFEATATRWDGTGRGSGRGCLSDFVESSEE